MSSTTAAAPVVHKLVYIRDGNAKAGKGKPVGDARFTLDAEKSGAKRHGEGDNFYLPVTDQNGHEVRLPLRRNVYRPASLPDVSTVEYMITAQTVAGSAPVAAAASDANQMAKAGDAAGLTAFYSGLPGVSASQAGKLAAAAIKAAKA